MNLILRKGISLLRDNVTDYKNQLCNNRALSELSCILVFKEITCSNTIILPKMMLRLAMEPLFCVGALHIGVIIR